MRGACGRNGQSENGAVFGRGTSLSLSLSRCSHFLASLWAEFKGLFYSFYRNFILSCRKFFLFHRGFLSSFCLQKAFFRALCFFKIFKRFVFGLFELVIDSRFRKNGGFCHFEPFAKRRPNGLQGASRSKKIYKDKRKLAIFGYFAVAQYDKKIVWYDKFGLSPKNNRYFHSNRFQKIEKFNTKESK